VRSYVNVNLSRLERFVEREIYFRETADQVVRDSISKEEVIDETIAAALGDGATAPGEKPERLALEPWLYRLAIDALDQLSRPEGSNGGAVRLEESARKPNVKASDEPELQFHQPDEAITEETIIADDRVATPEQIVGSDEMMRLIASCSARHGREPSRGLHPACHRRLRRRRNLRHHRRPPESVLALHFCRARSPAQIAQLCRPIQRAVRAHRDRVNPIPTKRSRDRE
jgi:hypothetical protein